MFGQGRPLVGFKALLSNGTEVDLGTDLEKTTNDITLAFADAPMDKETRLLTVTNSGLLGIVRIDATFTDWVTLDDMILENRQRIEALEAAATPIP